MPYDTIQGRAVNSGQVAADYEFGWRKLEFRWPERESTGANISCLFSAAAGISRG
jgi:hypothetical protein